jgi:hypothetical protein
MNANNVARPVMERSAMIMPALPRPFPEGSSSCSSVRRVRDRGFSLLPAFTAINLCKYLKFRKRL